MDLFPLAPIPYQQGTRSRGEAGTTGLHATHYNESLVNRLLSLARARVLITPTPFPRSPQPLAAAAHVPPLTPAHLRSTRSPLPDAVQVFHGNPLLTLSSRRACAEPWPSGRRGTFHLKRRRPTPMRRRLPFTMARGAALQTVGMISLELAYHSMCGLERLSTK